MWSLVCVPSRRLKVALWLLHREQNQLRDTSPCVSSANSGLGVMQAPPDLGEIKELFNSHSQKYQ